MAKTLAQELDEIEAAITAVLGGAQSYTDADGHNITYPSLADLRIMRAEIRREVTRGDISRIKVSEF